jgi:hypothetical protein
MLKILLQSGKDPRPQRGLKEIEITTTRHLGEWDNTYKIMRASVWEIKSDKSKQFNIKICRGEVWESSRILHSIAAHRKLLAVGGLSSIPRATFD